MPGVFDIRNRPTVKGPVNPLDNSTIVSIYDRQIIEYKHTLQPGQFIIERGTFEKPSLTVVGPSSWWKDVDPTQPLIEIVTGSIQIAESVIRDYCSGLFGCNLGDSMPGLFFVPGKLDHKTLLGTPELMSQLKAAQRRQDTWFRLLVKFGDSFWARSNGNPLTVMDDMRIAAQELGLDKEWAKEHIIRELVRCVACGTLRNPAYPKCGHCLEIVDKDLAKKLGIL